MSITRTFYSTDEAERNALEKIANLAGITLQMDSSESTKLVICQNDDIVKTFTTLDDITAYLQKFLVDYDDITAAEIVNEAKLERMNLSSYDNAIMRSLDARQVSYHTLEHEAIVTAEDLVAAVMLDAGCAHTKNLLLKDKKHGLFLVILNAHNEDSTSINGSKVSKILASKLSLAGKVRFEFYKM